MHSNTLRGVYLRALLFLSLLLAAGLGAAAPALATAPPAPTGLTGKIGHALVTLTWNASAGATSYNLYRSTVSGAEARYVTGITATTYQDTGLNNGQVYYYEVVALNTQTSPFSAEIKAIPNIHIDCGATAPFPDTSGVVWAADTGTTDGTTTSTQTQQIPPTDQGLYQTQRTETSSGSGVTYVLPVASGSYVLMLKLSEIDPNVKLAKQRVFNVTANGTQILTGVDIIGQCGQQNKEFYIPKPIYINNASLTLKFTGTVGTAAVAAFSLQPPTVPAGDVPPPGYAAGSVPGDDSPTGGDGPASSFSVVLPSLIGENHPGADIDAYNPAGPSVSYERSYRSNLTTAAYAAPGMAVGWTDNYDISVVSANPTAWSALTLTYGNLAKEAITPTVTGGTATFTHPAGAPYLMTGVPSGTTGLWTSLTLTMKDHSQMTFTPADPGAANVKYVLTRITNLVGRYVTINRDTAANGSRVLSVQNDLATPTTLLQFGYTGTQLTSVQDVASAVAVDHRQITYTYGSYGLLSSVSQIAAVGATGVPDRWRYSYQLVGLLHYLAAVDVPNPANFAQYSRAKLLYDANGFVATSSDAAGRLHAYTSGAGAMRVDAYNVNGSPAMNFIRNFGSFGLPGAMATNVDTGFRDGNIHTETMGYTDTNNPWMPTQDINRNGQQTNITYNDAFGNPATVQTPRGVKVTNTYDFNSFPLGQVTTTQETHVTGGTTDATKQATTYTYYSSLDGPSNAALIGLVKTITSPAPDSTVGAPSLVTTTITYTLPSATSAGGQVATVTTPGNNTGGSLVTTYNYTSDPSYDANGVAGTGYTQNEQLGEPLTVTNPNGEVAHYRYDGRGHLTLSIDAWGYYRANYVYNIADQLVQTIFPPTSTTARALTQTNYGYPGGPPTSEQVYDESGALVREVDTAYTADGEVASVTGSTEPASYTYDALSRVSTLTDGNGHVTHYSYDAVGNVSLIQYPGVSGAFDTLTFGYDADQNLKTKIDGRGITTTYARNDPESLVTGISYTNLPATVTPIGATSYSYDMYGRLSVMSDISGTTSYPNYDDLDEPLLMSRSFRGGPQNQQIAYAHYPDGSRRTLTLPTAVTNPLTGINNGNFTYQYDAAGRQTQMNVPFKFSSYIGATGAFLVHTWNPNGWLSGTKNLQDINNYSVVYTNYGMDSRGFLTGKFNRSFNRSGDYGYEVIDFDDITNDALGNRTYEHVQRKPIAYDPIFPQDQYKAEIRFGYDTSNATATQNRDVLTSVSSAPDPTSYNNPAYYHDTYVDNFLYDPAYNITNYSVNGVPGSFGSTSDNQINNSGYLPDGNGNMATYNNAIFSYDPEDRLTGISSPAFSATYDANGLRATKTSANGTTYFLYDGSQLLLEETSNGGAATVAALNIWGVDGWDGRYYPAIDKYHGFATSPEGNVVGCWSSDEKILEYSAYDAYGTRIADFCDSPTDGSPPATQEPAGFGGQYGYYTDRETGLVYMSHRYYDPATGRFISRDPIGYQGGVNLYAFCGGNPVNESDPNGTAGTSTYNPQIANSLIRRILNVDLRIQRRIGELRENPQDLPEDAGSEAKPRASRSGHRRLINEDKALVDELQAELEQEAQKSLPEPTKFQKWLSPRTNSQLAAGSIGLSLPIAVGAVAALPEEAVATGAALLTRGAALLGRALSNGGGRALANGGARALANAH